MNIAMTHTKPSDWDWVVGVHDCSPAEMFDKLRRLAEQNVKTRNTQRDKEAFNVLDTSYGFSVGEVHDGFRGRMYFSPEDPGREMRIKVSGPAGRDPVYYTVRLDPNGCCKLWIEEKSFDPWQVLKKALEPLLF